MAIVLYRCQSCGEVHEASLRPGGGSVYLRCIVTRAWAWHEPSHFLISDAPTPGRAPARPPARKAAAPKRGGQASKAPVRRAVAKAKVAAKKASSKGRKH